MSMICLATECMSVAPRCVISSRLLHLREDLAALRTVSLGRALRVQWSPTLNPLSLISDMVATGVHLRTMLLLLYNPGIQRMRDRFTWSTFV